ncbi:NIPSNAP family protein [Sediminicoccus rosea]|jgi:hypothetical protein|uniref:NIPSNAP family protein n=1 Tax=Sediminicoccus rosea TaxID=1225128 RepID=A0ABZ0PJR3_9PROT|nr:NIPSNAP family protein [Sediminicoccus rosea]WPB85968.1 NIPSNAP family protein [Sediminicoccus rosea]
MIVEERDYRLKPGKLGLFVSTYEKHGLPLQVKYLGKFLGYFTTEIGELNHVVALWGYEGLDDRARRRAAMLADPQWQEYLGMVADYLDVQSTRILTPSSFSPIQ